MNMLGHAWRGVEAGAAKAILVVAGDMTGLAGYAKIAANYNSATRDHLAPLGHGGPNGVYSLVTIAADEEIRAGEIRLRHDGHRAARLGRHEPVRGLPQAADHGGISRRADGRRSADALRLRADHRRRAGDHHRRIPTAAPRAARRVRVRAIRHCFNYDNQEGDGLETGISTFADELWQAAGVRPERHRRRQHLRRLSGHGAGAAQRPRLHPATTTSRPSRAATSASGASRSTPGAA